MSPEKPMTGSIKKSLILALLAITIFVSILTAGSSEHYFKFYINDKSELAKLSRIISIDNVDSLTVFAYANDEQWREFEALGYTHETLPHPGTLITPEMATDKSQISAWDVYPSYDAYLDMMNQFAADYPGLCQIVNAGLSVNGRSILYAKISDNVGLEEDEPEVLYSSTIHGDETTGYVLMLRLIDSLLVGYGADSLITRLVDSCEIWINPLANPDGTYAGGNNTVYGATRYNANGVDLNRNFPDPDNGPHPDGRSWQAETIVTMDFAGVHSPVISGNFHGGAEVINYPWDTWSRFHPDNDWYVNVCRQYVDSAHFYSPAGYLDDLDNGITNGFDWYEVQGGRQDFMNYWHGCREVTMEISGTKLLPANQLPNHWIYNRVSFLDWLEHALYGIRGVVTDAVTGDPVFATITIIGHDTDIDSSRVFTDPDFGDYHRMIEAGVYDIEFRAVGYYSDTVTGVTVADGAATRVDISLWPLPMVPDLRFISHNAGIVDPGDSVSFSITLINDGIDAATGVNADLSSSDAYITIIQAGSAFPDIAALGGTGTSLNAYQFSVSPACPQYHTARFMLDITADGEYAIVDSFDITVGQIIENFESGNLSLFPWEGGGDQPWSVIDIDPFEGIYSAKSGAIGDNEVSRMGITVNVSEAGTIAFNFRVSSENGFDFLRFYIGDTEAGAWSGDIAWTETSFAVEPGLTTFMWEYTKDVTVSDGDDCAWLDKIIFPPITNPNLEIVTTSLPDWTIGHPYSQSLEASGSIGTLDWIDKYDDLAGSGLSLSSDGLLSGIPAAAQSVTFTAEVTDQASGTAQRILAFTINPAPAITTLTLPQGNINENYSQQLQAEGGTGGYTWSDKNNDLAMTGLTLSASGLLSGTVTDTATVNFIALVHDSVGVDDEQALSILFIRPYLCGDASGDSQIDVGDAVFLINYIFRGGQAPEPFDAGLVNGDDLINIGDVVYLINFIFREGEAPICP